MATFREPLIEVWKITSPSKGDFDVPVRQYKKSTAKRQPIVTSKKTASAELATYSIGCKMTGGFRDTHEGQTFINVLFTDCIFSGKFFNCTFIKCKFRKCAYKPEAFLNSQFLDCSIPEPRGIFHENGVNRELTKEIVFVNCRGL